MTQERLLYLIQQWEKGQLAEAEDRELNEWFGSGYTELFHGEERDAVGEALLQSYLKQHPHEEPAETPARRLHPWRWVAAASVLLVLLAGGWHFLSERKPVQPVLVAHDALPGGNHAMLTLADGRQIILDSTGNGNVASQNGVQVIKLDSGKLAYKGNGAAVAYNTLATPRGGQYQIILPDGSQVWLNSASSLQYPTAFTGRERMVTLSGEAYFEVAHNAAKPFKVNSNGQTVTVLGTHFNINSYADENATTTTLLEGRVSVTSGNAHVLLAPGYAARQQQGKLSTGKADAGQAVAWKEGILDMDGQPFVEIMRQISRWYDVDIVYEGKIPDMRLNGQMDKGLKLSQLLKVLQLLNVHFRIEGKKLIVGQ
ncbi:MAG: FecR domain-containing protein [Arachidicoccus sp.]|nr:FecR domain-containing protein [Arachidicoccus sp.]